MMMMVSVFSLEDEEQDEDPSVCDVNDGPVLRLRHFLSRKGSDGINQAGIIPVFRAAARITNRFCRNRGLLKLCVSDKAQDLRRTGPDLRYGTEAGSSRTL